MRGGSSLSVTRIHNTPDYIHSPCSTLVVSGVDILTVWCSSLLTHLSSSGQAATHASHSSDVSLRAQLLLVHHVEMASYGTQQLTHLYHVMAVSHIYLPSLGPRSLYHALHRHHVTTPPEIGTTAISLLTPWHLRHISLLAMGECPLMTILSPNPVHSCALIVSRIRHL